MSSSDDYNFEVFLKKLDPSSVYSITRCTGGMINVTVRATKVLKDHPAGNNEVMESKHIPAATASVVMKYASPFIYGMGTDIPFPQVRQNIEAAALRLFTTPDDPLHYLTSGPGAISVPQLLVFDEEEHILVLEDLGNLSSVEDWIQATPLPTLETCRHVGARVGTFIAKLHTAGSRIPDDDHFNIRVGRDLIKLAIVDTIPGYLAKFEIGEYEHDRIHQIVAASHMREDGASLPLVFSIGDFWPPSVIMSSNAEKVGIIDWEFASYAPPMQDLAQICITAHLHLLLLAAEEPTSNNVRELLDSMHNTYRRKCEDYNAEWLQPESRHLYESIRVAWIIHGREMINNAAEREWPGCIPLSDPQAFTCALRRRMAKVGARYIDVAGKDVLEMRTKWEEVINETILRPMYIDTKS